MVGREDHVRTVRPPSRRDRGQDASARVVDQLVHHVGLGVDLADLIVGQLRRNEARRSALHVRERAVPVTQPVSGLALQDGADPLVRPRVPRGEVEILPGNSLQLRLRRIPRMMRIGERHPTEPRLVVAQGGEPVRCAVGHPVGVVPLPRDRVVLGLGRPGVPARLPPQEPGETVQVLRMVGLEPAAVVGKWASGRPRPRAWPARSDRTPATDRCLHGPHARSPRNGGPDRSRARSAPCPAARCGSRPSRRDSPRPMAHRPGVRSRWPRRRASARTAPSAWSSGPACTRCSGCRPVHSSSLRPRAGR